MSIGYLIMNRPYGAPYTIDQAYPSVREATIVFGFPDILIKSEDAYPRIVEHLHAKNADAVFGLFPTDQPDLCSSSTIMAASDKFMSSRTNRMYELPGRSQSGRLRSHGSLFTRKPIRS